MKPYVDPWLRRLGIDPRRYWLLLDLFKTLSGRQELMNQNLGHDRNSLNLVMFIYAGLGVFLAVLLIMSNASEANYLKSFLALTVFTMVMVLLVETANTLVNPVEGVILAHQPINGATYTAAKLTHLGRIVVYLAGGMNLVPAMAGYALKNTTLLYPLGHLLSALALGFAIALGCCALFGWMLRFVPASRMKMASQVLTGTLVLSLQMGSSSIFRLIETLAEKVGPRTQAALIVLGVIAIVLGLRTLSADYLIRASHLVQGAAGKSRRTPWRSLAGASIGRLGGGPAARAGFAFVSLLCRRDWHFLRGIITLLPASVILGTLLLRGSFGNPFAGKWTGLLVAPHLLGFVIFTVCSTLMFGAHHEASWLFGLAPDGAFPRFARGVFGYLWLALVLVPHFLLAPVLFYRFPWLDATLFVAFSAAVACLYLALSLRLVDGLPFGSAPQADRSSVVMPALLIGGALAASAVAVEYMIFQSRPAVALATVMVAALALWFSRSAVRAFAIATRFDLARRAPKRLSITR